MGDKITSEDGLFVYRGSQHTQSLFAPAPVEEPAEPQDPEEGALKDAIHANLRLQALVLEKLDEVERQKDAVKAQIRELRVENGKMKVCEAC